MPVLKNIKTICVCGAGTMGSGIAQVAAQAGFSTIQFDVNEVMLEKSKASIVESLKKFQEKGKITEAERNIIYNRITFTSEIEHCKANIIIEAIVEKKEAKVELINKLSAINELFVEEQVL